MVVGREGYLDKALTTHREHDRHTSEIEGSFSEHRFACQERFRHPRRQTDGPVVVAVGPIGERHEKSGVCDRLHRREKPFLLERFRGPRIAPASLMKERMSPLALAFSNCSRMISP